jgi:prepilin-type N-terminal cleavage/methylation domain-containing protein
MNTINTQFSNTESLLATQHLSHRKNAGFTLIETLLAITVIAVVFSVAIPVFVSFAGINRISERRTVANNAVRQSLELLRNVPIPTMPSSGNIVQNLTLDGHALVITTYYCPVTTAPCNATSKNIKVEVKEDEKVLTTISTVFSDYNN